MKNINLNQIGNVGFISILNQLKVDIVAFQESKNIKETKLGELYEFLKHEDFNKIIEGLKMVGKDNVIFNYLDILITIETHMKYDEKNNGYIIIFYSTYFRSKKISEDVEDRLLCEGTFSNDKYSIQGNVNISGSDEFRLQFILESLTALSNIVKSGRLIIPLHFEEFRVIKNKIKTAFGSNN